MNSFLPLCYLLYLTMVHINRVSLQYFLTEAPKSNQYVQLQHHHFVALHAGSEVLVLGSRTMLARVCNTDRRHTLRASRPWQIRKIVIRGTAITNSTP
ncbi:hypothetical protein EDB83DRAFT_2366950 [Lactarius deliciosus]|nr:hypothetical protein EDB83DRAFT_2366950 [Lactarius deliciosus]